MNIYLITDSFEHTQAQSPSLRNRKKSVLALDPAPTRARRGTKDSHWTLASLELTRQLGLTLLQELRRSSGKRVIVAAAAEHTPDLRMQCYTAGADIVLADTPSHEEMLALAKAQMRALQHTGKTRSQAPAPDIELHYGSQQLHGPNGVVNLTPRECVLLQGFVQAKEQKLNHQQIGDLFGFCDHGSRERLAMAVHRLRIKLVKAGADPHCLRAIHRLGFQLAHPVKVR